MSAALHVLRLDLLTARPYAKQMLLLLGLAGVLGAVMGEPSAVMPMTVVYAILATGYPFAVADKNDLDTLYRVLPVRRSSLVVGRYLFALTLFGAAALGGAPLMLGVAATQHEIVQPGEAGRLLAVAFALFGVVVALQYPCYVALGYMKARLVAIVPFALLGAAGAVLGDRLDPASLPDPGAAVLLLVGGTLALMAASLAASLTLDARRVA